MQGRALLKVPSLLCSLRSPGLAFWLAWLEGVGGQWFRLVNRRGYPTGQGDPSCAVARMTCCQVLAARRSLLVQQSLPGSLLLLGRIYLALAGTPILGQSFDCKVAGPQG